MSLNPFLIARIDLYVFFILILKIFEYKFIILLLLNRPTSISLQYHLLIHLLILTVIAENFLRVYFFFTGVIFNLKGIVHMVKPCVIISLGKLIFGYLVKNCFLNQIQVIVREYAPHFIET